MYFVRIVTFMTVLISLKSAFYYNDLLSTEALFIKKLQPNLNNQLGPDKGSRVSINTFK